MDSNEQRASGLQRLVDGFQGLSRLGLLLLVPAGIVYLASESKTFPTPQGESRQSSATEELSLPLPIRCLSVSANGEYVDVIQGEATWSRCDAHTGRPLEQRIVSGEPLVRAALRSDGGILASVKFGSKIEIRRELETISLEQPLDLQPNEMVAGCAVAAEQNLAAVVSDRGSLWLWEFDDVRVVSQRRRATGGGLSQVELSPSGDRAALVTEQAELLIQDTKRERLVSQREPADGATRVVRWSGDGGRLITFGFGGSAAVWSAETAERLHRWKAVDTQSISAAALSADGGLAAVAEDDAIRIWDVESEQEILKLTGHRGIVSVLQFADDDRTLFSGDTRGQLRRWSLHDGREVWAAP